MLCCADWPAQITTSLGTTTAIFSKRRKCCSFFHLLTSHALLSSHLVTRYVKLLLNKGLESTKSEFIFLLCANSCATLWRTNILVSLLRNWIPLGSFSIVHHHQQYHKPHLKHYTLLTSKVGSEYAFKLSVGDGELCQWNILVGLRQKSTMGHLNRWSHLYRQSCPTSLSHFFVALGLWLSAVHLSRKDHISSVPMTWS